MKTLSLFPLLALTALGALAHPADALLERDPPPRRLDAIGKRLDTTIGADLETLADAYAETKDARYRDRLIVYLRAAADYTDWKPDYYLTCAPIMNGVSRALEVCGATFDEAFRAEMQDILLKKGLKGSFLRWWWWSNDNWTQVCCRAIAAAALQIRDRHPSKAESYLADAIGAVKRAMAAYGPDGCYAEGPAYWGYATENTENMITMLRRCNGGDDGGLSDLPGYRQSFDWIRAMTGPSGQIFNYADGWRPGDGHAEGITGTVHRIWNGRQPTGLLSDGRYWLAVKGGSATVNHAHMDAGSFVFETFRQGGGGVRWIEDPYTEDYGRMERAGLDVWNTGRKSTRWRVFRQGVESHAVFTVDGEDFRVDGAVGLSDDGGDLVADCTPLYRGIWKKAERRWHLTGEGLRLTDAFEGVEKGRKYVFNFTTFAAARIESDRLVLERDGESVTVSADRAGAWEIQDVSAPRAEYDSPNPNLTRVVFRAPLEDGAISFLFR